MDLSEKRFEQDIEGSLLQSGYEQFSYQNDEHKWIYKEDYDAERAIYLDVLVRFIEATQPKEWARYQKYYGKDSANKLYRRLEDVISNNGLIYVLRNGIEDMGVKIKIAFFKPESDLNAKDKELYEKNIIGVTRQFAYSAQNHNTIDMALSVNGIPVVALELKNQLKGQDVSCAVRQFREDRDCKELCFRLNHRFLVYFAVDLHEVKMTTELKGDATYFLPFNQGSEGPGKAGGAGNPANPEGYVTSYLWQRVLKKDSLMDILHRFVSYVEEKEEATSSGGIIRTRINKKIIFPRFHQFDVVHKVLEHVRASGPGHNYLIEHSAGSGKSNSIAWIAYRLASLHNSDNEPVFNSIIVVTNRVVLDSQLQDTINSFEHVTGLVEAIDEKKRSRGLADAINDKKRIIICTIQKFLFAYKDFDDLDGRKFAIIIDEAHQGQSGESARTLRKALIDRKVAKEEYAEEEGIKEEEVEESDIINELLSQGQHSNQSFFAFTATPKNKTIEIFGTDNPLTGKKEPFHVYSMRQAIEEGFILDVLSSYTTIQEAFKIVKISQDNPELVEGQAARALFRYYKEHGFTIKQKTEMIMSNFLENGRYKINGRGKAMIVADSRANAVRYYYAVKEYIKANPARAAGSDVLVAFSGNVNIDGKEMSESSLNIDENKKAITSDRAFRKAFRSEKYNILVAANKYQTGFDEPLLHSMYVDKKLKSVNAVQTLSRLNRTCRYKEDTFILDFENKVDDIKASFQPFYEATLLVGNTDYNRVYDLRTKILQSMLYDSDAVDEFYKFVKTNSDKKQSSAAIGRLTNMFKPVIDKYNELERSEKFKFRDYVIKFNKSYSYITQLVRLHDEELFKEYVFTSHLVKFLPSEPTEIISIEDKIKLEFASLKETFKGAISLDRKSLDLKPDASIKAIEPAKKKDTLESIVDKVNEKYSGNFTDSDRVIIKGIYDKFMTDSEIKKFRKLANDNNSEMFVKSLFPEKFQQIVTACYLENNNSFQKLFNDTDFYKEVMEQMAKELYKALRKK